MRQALSKIFRRTNKKPTPAALSETVEKNFIEYALRDMAIFENGPSVASCNNIMMGDLTSHPLRLVARNIKTKVLDNDNLSEKFALLQNVLQQELELYSSKLNKQLPIDDESLIQSLPSLLVTENKTSSSSSSSSGSVDSSGGVMMSMLRKLTDEDRLNKETVFRLTLGQHYFKTLEELVNQQPELSKNSVTKKFSSLVDCILLGTSTERVQEHMQLFGSEMDQETMQSCFYPLYEAEIESTNKLLKMYPLGLPRHEKKIQKLTNGYLLDTLELNTKIRCIMAWSDPNHGRGYAPVSDDLKLPMDILIKGRAEFFKEGETMGRTYLTAVRGVINNYYEQKRDNRELMRNAVIFFVCTCIGDYIVCSI